MQGLGAASRTTCSTMSRRMSMTGQSTRSTCTRSCVPCRRAWRASCAVTVRMDVVLTRTSCLLGVPDQVNASWACENDRTLNQILKGELGFQGYVMSDWGGHHSTLAAVAGLDVRVRMLL